jgi:hypothetical protein
MTIFSRSRKSKETTSQANLNNQVYESQVNLQDPYSYTPSGNVVYSAQGPHTSHTHNNTPRQQWGTPQYQPIHITQNFLLTPPVPEQPQRAGNSISTFNLNSVSNLLTGQVPQCIPGAQILNTKLPTGTQYLNQGAALCDLITSKLDTVLTQIDTARFSGDERELAVFEPQPMWQQEQAQTSTRDLAKSGKSKAASTSTLTSTNYFSKVNLYANSRLPPNLPPMKV